MLAGSLLEGKIFSFSLFSYFFLRRQDYCNAFMKLTTAVCSALQAGSKSFAMLVVGRFIGGIGVGVLSSTAPTYISEIAPPNVRGAFLALEGSSIVIGIVIMFYIVGHDITSCKVTVFI